MLTCFFWINCFDAIGALNCILSFEYFNAISKQSKATPILPHATAYLPMFRHWYAFLIDVVFGNIWDFRVDESEKINYYDLTGSTCKAKRQTNRSATEAIIKYNSSLGTPDFLSTLSGIRGPYDRLGISTIATYEWKSS